MIIDLTQGLSTIVDDIDADLSDFKWYAAKDRYTYYARRNIQKFPHKTEQLHATIMQRILCRSLEKGEIVDHVDRNGLNNIRSNLRITTHRGNGMNTRIQKNNTSGYRGVTWHSASRKWMAQLKYKGKTIYCGLHDTPELASIAYNNKLQGLGLE